MTRNLQNKEFHAFHFLLNTIRLIEQKITSWTVHASLMGETSVLVGKLEGKPLAWWRG